MWQQKLGMFCEGWEGLIQQLMPKKRGIKHFLMLKAALSSFSSCTTAVSRLNPTNPSHLSLDPG